MLNQLIDKMQEAATKIIETLVQLIKTITQPPA